MDVGYNPFERFSEKALWILRIAIIVAGPGLTYLDIARQDREFDPWKLIDATAAGVKVGLSVILGLMVPVGRKRRLPPETEHDQVDIVRRSDRAIWDAAENRWRTI
mgnify:CR=1 FL=1